jgi:hypothetical protein
VEVRTNLFFFFSPFFGGDGMPFQARKCEGCGEYDYVEWVEGRWLCKYCREVEEELKELGEDEEELAKEIEEELAKEVGRCMICGKPVDANERPPLCPECLYHLTRLPEW